MKAKENRRVPLVVTPTGSYYTLADSFKRALLAQNISQRTLQTYMEAVTALGDFLRARGMPTEIEALTREHVQEFITDLLTHRHKITGRPLRPTTASNRYKSLQSFFKWALEEGEIQHSPMEYGVHEASAPSRRTPSRHDRRPAPTSPQSLRRDRLFRPP